MLETIQDRFHESIQVQIASADDLPQALAEAAQNLANCLLQGKKILVCGYGRSYANAQLLVSNLLHRYEMMRPNLAVHLLNFDGMLAAHIEQDQELEQLYKKQLQTLVNEGDMLVAFSPHGHEAIIVNAIHAAKNENLSIVVLSGSRNDHTQSLLGDGDVEIKIPSLNELRVVEGHQFCVNLLSELIDNVLFSPNSV